MLIIIIKLELFHGYLVHPFQHKWYLVLKGTDLYGVLLRMSHVLNESNDSNNNNNNNNKWSQYYIHNSPIIVDILKEF